MGRLYAERWQCSSDKRKMQYNYSSSKNKNKITVHSTYYCVWSNGLDPLKKTFNVMTSATTKNAPKSPFHWICIHSMVLETSNSRMHFLCREKRRKVEVERERQVQRRLYMILNYGKHHVQMFVWTISDALLSYPIELKFIRIKFYIGKFSLVYDNINLNMHPWWGMIKIRMQCWMFEPVLLKRLSKSIIPYIKKNIKRTE